MGETSLNEKALREALRDVGCDSAMQNRCAALLHDGMTSSVCRQLERHRARLLEQMRAARDGVERIDRLLHELSRSA